MNDIVLSMRDIDKRFAGVHALKKVDFELREGEIHALVGENGAGKSTLIGILAGSNSMDYGEILIDGTKVNIDSPKAGISS